ncbi:hypothetical protein BH23PLA1_BH23PLA1_17160 [soil metagenome]
MTPYDVAMIAVVVGGMVWGAWRGITWQLASIASLVLGYMVAFPLSVDLAPRFPGEPIVARALALLVLYVAVSAAVFLVAWSIRATLRRWKFEAFDRHLGMILGGLEGALLGIVVTIFVVSLAPTARVPILTSRSGIVVDHLLKAAKPALPVEIAGMLAPFWEALESSPPGETSVARDDSEVEVEVEVEVVAEVANPQPDPAPKADSGLLRSAFEKTGARFGRTMADEFEQRFQSPSNENGRDTPRR